MKKVAIIHDIFLAMGGAERVFLHLLAMYPKADVYTALITPEYTRLVQKQTTGNVHSSIFSRLGLNAKFASFLKPVLFQYWEGLDLSSYDLVISSSHSFSAKSVKTAHSTKHISYIYTPPRYLYNEFNEMGWLRMPFLKTVVSPLMHYLRKKDFEGGQRPNILIASSKTVRDRIQRYYHRNSMVIYPPVRIPKKISQDKPLYYLCLSRLVKQKGLELAIKACNTLGEQLLIVGTGPEETSLRKIAGPTVSFLGYVPDDRISAIYLHAKALLYCAREEDFGMVPIEAMAHGVPVIGYKSGGVQETIIPGQTGLLFTTFSTSSLIKTMKLFETITFSPQACRKHAKQFSQEQFTKKIRQLLSL